MKVVEEERPPADAVIPPAAVSPGWVAASRGSVLTGLGDGRLAATAAMGYLVIAALFARRYVVVSITRAVQGGPSVP